MAKIQFLEQKGSILIKPPAEMGQTFSDELNAESKDLLALSSRMFIFYFTDVKVILPNAYRGFVIFARAVRQAEKQISSVHMLPELSQQIQKDGVAGSFNPMADLAAHKGATGSQSKAVSLDLAIINPFIKAVISTLEIQAQTPSKPGKAYLMKSIDKVYSPAIAIVGIINLSSSKFNGSIALAFPEDVFLKVYENMFGEKHEKITAELQDAASEILNIIYGTAKTQLNQIPGFDLQPAIPTVLAGEKLNLQQTVRDKIIILPFESSAGVFQMEIALEAKQERI